MIDRSELVAVTHRRLLMLLLFRRPFDMPVMHSCFLPGIRAIAHTTRTTVIAHLVDCHIVDHRPVDIGVVYDCRIDPGHRRVVPETSIIPFTTIISTTAISTSVVDPPIVTYVRAPVADMPGIDPADKSPVTRRP